MTRENAFRSLVKHADRTPSSRETFIKEMGINNTIFDMWINGQAYPCLTLLRKVTDFFTYRL